MRKQYLTCPHCKGDGRLELTGVYLETLIGVRLLCAKSGHVIANQHAPAFDCKPTALNNRLRRLEELGFLVSERYGRQRRFKVKA